jgi:hypothetical protein|nr:MAG TPA: Pyocin activator protein PrtN [Caudoviricetes sp.]
MLEVMTAKAYAKRTGYPLETIRRMCRDGELPCDKRGKVYLIDFSAADLIIKERMLSAQAEKNETRQSKQRCRKIYVRSSNSTGLDYLSALNAI